MEVLILILVVAVIVGFLIAGSTSAKSLEVLDSADRKGFETAKEPVKKVSTPKPKPAAKPVATKPAKPVATTKPATATTSKPTKTKRKKT